MSSFKFRFLTSCRQTNHPKLRHFLIEDQQGTLFREGTIFHRRLTKAVSFFKCSILRFALDTRGPFHNDSTLFLALEMPLS